MDKKILDKIRNWVVNTTGEWSYGLMLDNELILYMEENYKEILDYFKGSVNMKYKMYIDETIKLRHQVEIDTGNLNDNALDDLLDNAEKYANSIGWKEFLHYLEDNGVKIMEVNEDNKGAVKNIVVEDIYELD